MVTSLRHRMPDDPAGSGDTSWFNRLNAFERQETQRQVRFKRKQWPCLADGHWAGGPRHTYPHILPAGYEFENLYPGIRDAALAYLSRYSIRLHREFANLRSSQACCLNFLFPLRLRLAQAGIALRSLLPGVTTVEQTEFEYTGPEGDGATRWLGEPPGGSRGQNRTSADAAVWWRDGDGSRRITLVEWKYTERQFGTCGGFASRGNDQKATCIQWRREDFDAHRDCYLERGDTSRNQRRYWEHLAEAGILLDSYRGQACPFMGPLYQLMRLHLLAVYVGLVEPRAKTDVAVVYFEGNHSLLAAPPELHGLDRDMGLAWRRLLCSPESFRTCSAEGLAAGIREVDPALHAYLSERYGV